MDTGKSMDESEIILQKKLVPNCNTVHASICITFSQSQYWLGRSAVTRVWGGGRSCWQRGTREFGGMIELFYTLIAVVVTCSDSAFKT